MRRSHPRLDSTGVTPCRVIEQELSDEREAADVRVLAAFDDGVRRLSRVIVDAAGHEPDSPSRTRAALTALLEFLDDEPRLARLLILQPRTAAVIERRQSALRVLAKTLQREIRRDAARAGSAAMADELAAELIVGGVSSVIRARMLEDPTQPLVELAPSLMSLIVAPYQRPDAGLERGRAGAQRREQQSRPRKGMTVRATYRTTRVLNAIGASPHLSNREIADAAGLSDEGQTSKLLRRLERCGLVENVGLGQPYGEANSWLLTAAGARVLDATRHSLVPGAGTVATKRFRGAT